MRILTIENKSLDVDIIGTEVDDLYFWILEYTGQESTDYYCKPLLFLENFSDIRLEVGIGPYNIHMPKDWSLLCVDAELGVGELLPPKMPGFNEKEFKAFVYNPQVGFKPDYLHAEVITPLPETRWVFPKLKFGQLLCVPLTDEEAPPCVYITHQKNNRVPEIIQPHLLF